MELDRKTLGEIHRLAKDLVHKHFSKPGVDEYANLADAAYDLCAWLDKRSMPPDMAPILRALGKLRPLFDGASGTYLGIYKEPAKVLCEAMDWQFDET